MSAGSSLRTLLRALWQEAPGLIEDRIELLTLELRRAGGTLARMLLLALAAVLLGLTAWAAFWAGLVVCLLVIGVHWAVVAGGIVLVNVAAALWLLMRARRLAPLLALPATRRHLKLGAPAPQALSQERAPKAWS